MNNLSKTLIALSLGLMVAAPAFAAHGEGQGGQLQSVNERLERQHQRIERGMDKHQLTRKEARLLRQQHRDIRYLARVFSQDGHLSKRERRILNRELDASSWQIKRLKHNDLERYVGMHQRYGKRDLTHPL